MRTFKIRPDRLRSANQGIEEIEAKAIAQYTPAAAMSSSMLPMP